VAEENFAEKISSLCYGYTMKCKKLSQSNPYLKNAEKRRASVVVSVCSSSAIEGIAAQKIVADYLSKNSNLSILHDSAKNG